MTKRETGEKIYQYILEHIKYRNLMRKSKDTREKSISVKN